MRMERRTTKQIAANSIDADLFRLSAQIERAAEAHAIPAWDELSRRIFGMRSAVRQHMHRDDRKDTE